MDKPKVQVVVKATGRKQYVPAHFVDHPVLGAGIELPPSVRAQSEVPNKSWRKAQLEAYAAEHGIDVGEASTKAALLEAIEAAPTTTPEAAPAADKTPATGDDKEN